MNDLKLQKAAQAKRAQEQLDEAKALAATIAQKNIVLKIKTGEGGRTFGSVSTKEIAQALKDQLGLEIDKKKLVLAEPLRNLGTFTVPIKLHTQVTAELKVRIDGV